MTKEEFIEQALRDRAKLHSLIGRYHPLCLGERQLPSHPITALGAEAACTIVRSQIRAKGAGRNPLSEFDQGLDTRDTALICMVLDEAWFGVPESTSCWNIEGFKEAVDLMDDPPEMEEAVTVTQQP